MRPLPTTATFTRRRNLAAQYIGLATAGGRVEKIELLPALDGGLQPADPVYATRDRLAFASRQTAMLA